MIIKIFVVFLLVIIFPYKCNAIQPQLEIDLNPINNYLFGIQSYNIDFGKLVDLAKQGNFSDALKLITDEFKSAINLIVVNNNKIMFTLLAICFFSCLLKLVHSEKSNNYSELVMVCFVSSLFTNIYIKLYETASQAVISTVGFMQVTLPVFFSVSSVFINKIPVSVYSIFLIFINFFQYLAINIIFPAINILLVLSVSQAIYPQFDICAIKKFILNLIHWLLGLYTTFFIIGVKLTQTVTYGTQRLFLTGIKYAVSRSVPVVGSFLSDTAEAMISSVVLLHNSIGVAGIAIIIIIVFAPFAAILFISAVFRLSGSVFYSVSKSSICNLFVAFSECLTELAVVLICVSVTFVIAVATEISAF